MFSSPNSDIMGQIIGVLQISGPSFKNNLHTLGLVVAAVGLIGDQIRLQNTSSELTILNNRMKNIILNVSDGIIVTNKDGIVIQVNPTAENILDRKEHEMKGSSVTDFIEKASVIQENALYRGVL